MKNYVSTGENLSVRANSAIKSGQFVVMGEAFGFAISDAAEGDLFALTRRGEYRVDLPGQPGAFVPVFVTASGQLTTSASGNRRIGMTGASGDTVILQEAFGGSASGGAENPGDGGDPGNGGGGSPQLSLQFIPAFPSSGEEMTILLNVSDGSGPVQIDSIDDLMVLMNGEDVDPSDLIIDLPTINYMPAASGDLNISVTVTAGGQQLTSNRFVEIA